MSFRINCTLAGYEYRGVRSGQGQNGTWMSLILESPEESEQIEVNVPQDLQADVYSLGLRKGQMLSIEVQAACGRTREGRNYDYIRYRGLNGVASGTTGEVVDF